MLIKGLDHCMPGQVFEAGNSKSTYKLHLAFMNSINFTNKPILGRWRWHNVLQK
jgi:hypothetical protein